MPWLRFLRDHFGAAPYVLITYDNAMPLEHAATLLECRTTLAVIDSRERGRRGADLNESEYVSEVMHRHAHTFHVQAAGAVFRYRCSSRRSAVTLPS
ncbi:MAG: hypothetical protein ACXVRS_08175 [Gaiellaceae bacterium]